MTGLHISGQKDPFKAREKEEVLSDSEQRDYGGSKWKTAERSLWRHEGQGMVGGRGGGRDVGYRFRTKKKKKDLLLAVY